MNAILGLEHYAGKMLSDVSLNGLYLDAQYLRKLIEGWEEQRSAASKWFFEQISVGPISGTEERALVLNSPKQLNELLYKKLKYPKPPKEVSDSQYRTDADSILWLKSQASLTEGAIFQSILDYRKATKLRSTYGERLIERAIANYIYPNVNIGDAETGRTTSNNPNIQNIPLSVRPAFCSRFQGGLIKGVDLSQIELRVAAFVSRDQYMIEAFRSGRDFHTETAVKMLGLKYDNITKEQRRIAKIINFGVLFLAGPGRIADEAGCSFEEAKSFINLYFQTFKGLKAWIEATLDFATRQKYVMSPLGRYRRVPFADRSNSEGMKQCREAVNAVIQGMASDIAIAFACLNYRNMKKETALASMMVPALVHDFFMVDCSYLETPIVDRCVQTSLNELVPFLKSKFQIDFDIPLLAEIDTGYRWDEKGNNQQKISNSP